MLVLAAVLFLVNFSNGQLPGDGPCPEVSPITNFDLKKYVGRWYGIERFVDTSRPGYHCRYGTYTLDEEPNHYTEDWHVINGTNVPINNTIHFELSGEPNEGIYNIVGSSSLFYILDTDYHTYKTVYNCGNNADNTTHTKWAYILSRHRFPPKRALKKAHKALRKVGLKPGDYELEPYPQKHCVYPDL